MLMFLGAALALQLSAADAQPGERALETELKVSGPAVYVRAPVGFRYRPGYVFPLQFRVHNPGSTFTAEVFCVEGSDDEGLRSGDFSATSFQAQSSRQVTLPVRAPAVTANLSVVIRETDASGGVAVQRFRARLRDLKPLPPEARLILSIGRPGSDVRPGLDVVVPQNPSEMLDEEWMYDSVDVVVLRDDAFSAGRANAREALRNFVLGGGRLLLTSESALKAAIAERLVPLEPGEIGAKLEWWEKHGISERNGDIPAKKNGIPIYGRMRMGLGQIVFLFPARDEILARDAGQAVFSHPALYREREKLADWRLQPDRYDAFSLGQVHSARAHRALLWMGLGALMCCAVLALAKTSRSRLESLGLPFAFSALVAVGLGQWFPEPDLIASRVVWSKQSADGRAAQWQEWKLIESFRRPLEITALAPDNGKVGVLYDRLDNLNQAQGDLDRVDGKLRLDHVWAQPSQPVMLYAARTETDELPGPSTHMLIDSMINLVTPAALPAGVQTKHCILARADGTLWSLQQNLIGEYSMKQFESPLVSIQSSLRLAGDKAKARATALGWATRDALRSKRDTLICWGEPPESELKSLVELEPTNYEVASSFFISSSEVLIRSEQK